MIAKNMIGAMGAMMERIGPMSVHHLAKPDAPAAGSLTGRVYAQMRRDFFVASPFMLHAPVPELLAGAWAVVRETLMTGDAPRAHKEVVATGVSAANQCPFCIGAHSAAVEAARADEPDLRAWAEATGRADAPALTSPPFRDHRAEYFGTVVAFHYLNRMVSAFLDDKLMPTPGFMDGAAHAMARLMMGGMMEKGRSNRAGDSAELLTGFDERLAWRPAWAEGSPHVARAIAAWSATCEAQAREHVDPSILERVGGTIEAWRGEAPDAPPFDSKTDEGVAPVAELAALTAMAPYRVRDAHLKAATDAGLSDAHVLTTVAWAAYRAARRAGDWTVTAAQPA